MRNRTRRFSSTIGIAISLIVVLLLLVLVQFLPRQVATQQAPQPLAQVIEATKPDSPLPTPFTPIVVIEPTWTAFPTMTPWPTPTRRPGATETAVEQPAPAQDASGTITIMTRTGDVQNPHCSTMAVSVDSSGSITSNLEEIPIDVELKFNPCQTFTSPQKAFVVYMEPVEPGGRPYVYNKTTGKVIVLFENYSGGNFYGWHPDGHRFLFWIDGVGLMLINAETLDIVTLAYPRGPVQGAAISPDGVTISYIDLNTDGTYGMWFVSTAGSDAKPQMNDANYMYSTAWSPDSSKLVYLGNCAGGEKDELSEFGHLCVYNLKSFEYTTLKLPFSGFAPVWSPDGKYIAATGWTQNSKGCEKQENLNPENTEKCIYQAKSIFVTNLETGDTKDIASGIAPIWSPDASLIAFLSNQTGTPELWVVGRDGSNAHFLTNDVNWKYPHSLSWLPEEKK